MIIIFRNLIFILNDYIELIKSFLLKKIPGKKCFFCADFWSAKVFSLLIILIDPRQVLSYLIRIPLLNQANHAIWQKSLSISIVLAVFSWILEVNAPKEKKKSMSVFVLELRIRSGLHSRKVELSHVKYFHAFVSSPNYISPIGASVRDLYHQHHGTMSCYLLSFEKAKTFFRINWIPKLVVQFSLVYFGIAIVSRRLCCSGLQGFKVDWNVRHAQQQDAGHIPVFSTRKVSD